MTVTSRGHIGFQKAVEDFEDQVINKIKRVVYETAEMLVAQAKALAPVDEGNLRDSINVTYYRGGLAAEIIVGANYAIYLEYGTGIYSTEGTGRKTPWVYFKNGRYYYTRGQEAQPFFHPSVEIARKHFTTEMNKIG